MALQSFVHLLHHHAVDVPTDVHVVAVVAVADGVAVDAQAAVVVVAAAAACACTGLGQQLERRRVLSPQTFGHRVHDLLLTRRLEEQRCVEAAQCVEDGCVCGADERESQSRELLWRVEQNEDCEL